MSLCGLLMCVAMCCPDDVFVVVVPRFDPGCGNPAIVYRRGSFFGCPDELRRKWQEFQEERR